MDARMAKLRNPAKQQMVRLHHPRTSSMHRRIFILVLKLLVLATVIAGAVYGLRFSPVPVTVHKVATGTIVHEVMGTGTLEARIRSSISTKISGLIASMECDQQDRVKKGQLLARIDDRVLRQQVEVAKADLAAKKAAIASLDANISRAKAVLVQSRSNLARVEQVLKSNAIAAAELDKAVESRDVAEANLELANSARAEAELVIVHAAEQLRLVQENLADAAIYAPYDGLIISRLREPGDAVVPGTTLFQMISTEQIWVSAWVDESSIGQIAVGQPARIVLRSAPATSLPGRIARIGQITDRETREFLVDVSVDALPAKWTVGQRAEVYIETARKAEAICLPQRLISWRKGISGVAIVKDGHAVWRKIAIGLRGNDTAEVTDGLSIGQAVIAVPPGNEPPRDGRAVKEMPK